MRKQGRYRARTLTLTKRIGPGKVKLRINTRKMKLPKVTVSYEVPD